MTQAKPESAFEKSRSPTLGQCGGELKSLSADDNRYDNICTGMPNLSCWFKDQQRVFFSNTHF